VITIAQLIALGIVLNALGILFQTFVAAIVSLLLLMTIMAFTHHELPGIARECGRLVAFVSSKPSTLNKSAESPEGQPAT
jgi:hypothetical protein